MKKGPSAFEGNTVIAVATENNYYILSQIYRMFGKNRIKILMNTRSFKEVKTEKNEQLSIVVKSIFNFRHV